MKNSIEETMKLYKYDYTEISFNIEDVCFSVYSFHNRDNSPIFSGERLAGNSKYEKSKRDALHCHPYIEVFFRQYGDYEVDLGDKIIHMGKDDLILMSPQTSHAVVDKNDKLTLFFNFFFKKNNIKTENKLFDLLTEAFSAPYIHIKKCGKFYELIKNLLANSDSGNVFMLSRYFYEIIIEVLSRTGKLTCITPDQMLCDSTVSRHRKISYLLSFYNNENISLKLIADSLNLSERQTARIIKEEFGYTLREIIQQQRMKQAEKYLKNKKMTIAEISAMVGYDSINCFYSAFKKHFGCLPKEYRKRL